MNDKSDASIAVHQHRPEQTNAIDEKFGERIRVLREERDWSLAGLALRYGGSRSYLYQIESGQSSPTLGVLVKLAQAFDLPLSELISLDVDSPDLSMGDDTRWFRHKTGVLAEVRFKEGLEGKHNADGLDEIVVVDKDFDFHLEALDKDHWWFRVNGISVWFHSSRPITVYWEAQDVREVDGEGLTAEEVERIMAMHGGNLPERRNP